MNCQKFHIYILIFDNKHLYHTNLLQEKLEESQFHLKSQVKLNIYIDKNIFNLSQQQTTRNQGNRQLKTSFETL